MGVLAMIHTQVIDTLDGALRLLSEQDENIQLKRYRNAFLYRGCRMPPTNL